MMPISPPSSSSITAWTDAVKQIMESLCTLAVLALLIWAKITQAAQARTQNMLAAKIDEHVTVSQQNQEAMGAKLDAIHATVQKNSNGTQS